MRSCSNTLLISEPDYRVTHLPEMKCTHRARLQDLIHPEEQQEDQTTEEDVHEHPVNYHIVFINSLTEC